MLPKVPPEFKVSRFHVGADQPRLIRTAPNGDIFVAESHAGQIRVLRPSGSCQLGTKRVVRFRARPSVRHRVLPARTLPTHIYVAESSRVVRYRYVAGDLVASGPAEVIVPDLPQGAGELPGQGHWTRDVAFSADGSKMYVSVGSYSNVQEEGEDETDRAAILEFSPDGSNRRIFASGLRNPVSLSVSPVTGALWATVNERDGLGDELVPDYVTAVWRDQFFGWPWFYIGDAPRPAAGSKPPAGLPPCHRPEGAAAGALGEPGRGLLYRQPVPGRVSAATCSSPCMARGTGPTRPAPR